MLFIIIGQEFRKLKNQFQAIKSYTHTYKNSAFPNHLTTHANLRREVQNTRGRAPRQEQGHGGRVCGCAEAQGLEKVPGRLELLEGTSGPLLRQRVSRSEGRFWKLGSSVAGPKDLLIRYICSLGPE